MQSILSMYHALPPLRFVVVLLFSVEIRYVTPTGNYRKCNAVMKKLRSYRWLVLHQIGTFHLYTYRVVSVQRSNIGRGRIRGREGEGSLGGGEEEEEDKVEGGCGQGRGRGSAGRAEAEVEKEDGQNGPQQVGTNSCCVST